MAAVQFYSSETLLNFCDTKEFESWGVFSGKNLVTSGEDLTQLREFLALIEPGGSAAVYSLKLYKTADPEEIDAKTAAFCMVNFKTGTGQSVGAMAVNSIEQRLAGIEKKLSERDEEEEEDEKEGVTDILIGYLKDPQKLALVLGAVRGLLSPVAPAAMPAVVGSVTTNQATNQTSNTMDSNKIERLGAAIDILEKKDPLLVDHLEKLAEIAKNKPAVFQMLLTMLDNNAV